MKPISADMTPADANEMAECIVGSVTARPGTVEFRNQLVARIAGSLFLRATEIRMEAEASEAVGGASNGE